MNHYNNILVYFSVIYRLAITINNTKTDFKGWTYRKQCFIPPHWSNHAPGKYIAGL